MARAERMRRGEEPFDPPGLPMYTAAQLLDCTSFMAVGPVRHLCEESAEFWRVFGGHLRAWLREEVLNGRVDEPEPAKYGATSLLMSIESGGNPCAPPDREPYAWAPLSGEDLLFDGVIHGMAFGWDARVVVDALSSFLGYLGRLGAIDRAHAQAGTAEIAAWTPRFLEAVQRS